MSTQETTRIVNAYYDCWKHGGRDIDAARLRLLVAPQLTFESSLSRANDVETFISGLARFAMTLKSHRILNLHCLENEASALYDCALTGPTPLLRTAEFFQIEHGKIQGIKLIFDATEFRKAMAQAAQAEAGPG
jgi:hypothetical protein